MNGRNTAKNFEYEGNLETAEVLSVNFCDLLPGKYAVTPGKCHIALFSVYSTLPDVHF